MLWPSAASSSVVSDSLLFPSSKVYPFWSLVDSRGTVCSASSPELLTEVEAETAAGGVLSPTVPWLEQATSVACMVCAGAS